VLPVVGRVLENIRNVEDHETQITIVDLCSGVGYLSIILAELLAGNPNIARFVLVDNAFPNRDAEAKPHHINPAHLMADDLWPIELTHRRYNLKSSSGHRQLEQHILARAPGPVMLLGVHLCGVLSIHAVQLFNDHPRCSFFALKPCCLPPIALAKQKFVWHVGGHIIDAKEVSAPGKYNKGKWKGPEPKSQQKPKFVAWGLHLHASIDVGEGGYKDAVNLQVINSQPSLDDQDSHCSHYQTLYIFAQRPFSPERGEVRSIGGNPNFVTAK